MCVCLGGCVVEWTIDLGALERLLGLNCHLKLQLCVFALEASLLGQLFVIRTSNFRGATISR